MLRGCTRLHGAPHRRRPRRGRRRGSGALGGHPSLLLRPFVPRRARNARGGVRPAAREPRARPRVTFPMTSPIARAGDAAPPTWPDLTLSAWEDTRNTFHMWTQVVGKIRLALEPMVNHWWQVTL